MAVVPMRAKQNPTRGARTRGPDRPLTPLRAGVAGMLATVVMDVIGRTLIAPVLDIQAPSPEALGRWIGHMRNRRFVHRDIALAQPVAGEAALGILAHYAIGLTLGVGYGLLLRARHSARTSLPLALSYGTATTAFSWLVMFPATGQGALGRRGGRKLPVLSLLNHTVYGLALGITVAKLPPH